MHNKLLPLLAAIIAVIGMGDVCAMYKKDNQGKKRYCPKRNRLHNLKESGKKINHVPATGRGSADSLEEQCILDLAIAHSLQDFEKTIDTENLARVQELSLEEALDAESLELAKVVSLSLQLDSDLVATTQETVNDDGSHSTPEDHYADNLALAQAPQSSVLHDTPAEQRAIEIAVSHDLLENQEELELFYSCDDDSSYDDPSYDDPSLD